MKKIKKSSLKVMAAIAVTLLVALPANAQLTDNGYASVDWQFNVPLSNNFADKASGWGMNLEGGCFLTPEIGVGLFMAYHSNHEYVGRTTIAVGDAMVNTDQQHTVFQLPFGVAGRYQFNRGGMTQPYFGLKMGPEYAKVRSNYGMFQSYDKGWGFFVSPELGVNVYPWAYGPGLHVALYYSYASNKADVLTYTVDGLNNFGFRLGIAF